MWKQAFFFFFFLQLSTPCDGAGTPLVDSGKKVLEGSTLVLHVNGDASIVGPVWIDFACEMLAFNCVILLTFALICTGCGELVMCLARSHMITCNCLYSLGVPEMGFI
jgi:hypothetical protein